MQKRNNLVAVLLLLSACGAQVGDGEGGQLEQLESMTYNSMTYNSMTYNALSANATANPVMPDVPLSTESYNGEVPELENQLSDPTGRTQEFFHYLVGCALAPGQIVKYEDRIFSGMYDAAYEGELGLCPSWNTEKATPECRQVVSSCLLARQNAFGVSVALSVRGHNGDGNWLETSSEEIKEFPWREGAFFGDVFGSLASGVNVWIDSSGVVKGDGFDVDFGESIYPTMYACFSDVWTSPEAYMHDRICAAGGTNCVATSVGDCFGHPTLTPTYDRCKSDDDGPEYGEGDYQFCEDNTGSGAAWENALTVWLKDPCDVVTDPNHCEPGSNNDGSRDDG